MKKTLITLIDFYNPQPEPTTAFCDKWLKEMSRYDVKDVKTGIDILMNNKKFFPTIDECLTFVDSAADTRRQREVKQEINQKPSRVERDADMLAWRTNLINFTSGKITRGEYLKRAVDIGQMTLAEANKEADRYKRRDDSMDSYCKNTGVLQKF